MRRPLKDTHKENIMSLLITLLIALIVGALLFYAARLIIEAFKIPSPFDKIILVIVILIIVLWIVERSGLL